MCNEGWRPFRWFDEIHGAAIDGHGASAALTPICAALYSRSPKGHRPSTTADDEIAVCAAAKTNL